MFQRFSSLTLLSVRLTPHPVWINKQATTGWKSHLDYPFSEGIDLKLEKLYLKISRIESTVSNPNLSILFNVVHLYIFKRHLKYILKRNKLTEPMERQRLALRKMGCFQTILSHRILEFSVISRWECILLPTFYPQQASNIDLLQPP